MKKTTIIFLTLFTLIGCSNTINVDNSNQIVVQQLRSDFKNGNFKALSTLITDYRYPTSKNDIKEIERIYQSINDKDSLQDLLDFIKAYNVIKEIFINGRVKYNKLLNLALKKNSQEARFIAITYYIERNNAVLIDKVEEGYIREASQEELTRLLALYKKHKKSLKEKNLIGIMKNKGFSIPQKQDLSACLHKFKESKELDDILDDICAKNNIDYIYQTAIRSKSSKHAVTLLKKILTLNPSNELRGKVYDYIYKIAIRSKSSKDAVTLIKKILTLNPTNELRGKVHDYIYEIAIRSKSSKYAVTLLKKILTLNPTNELRGKVYARLADLSLTRRLYYYRKAALLHNKVAARETLNYYYNNDSHQYQTLKDKLLKTDEGKKIIAEFYYKKHDHQRNRSYAYYLWEQLAAKGDDSVIIKLASLNFYKSYLRDEPNADDYEKNLLAKKWQDYIIKSKDIALIQKTKLLIKKRRETSSVKKLFLIQLNNALPDKQDILTLREVYHANTRDEEGLRALKKAIELGDVQSRYELANIYLNKEKSSAKGMKILKKLANEGDAQSAYRFASRLRDTGSQEERLNAFEQSIKYFKIASSLGSYNATTRLAILYLCKSCSSDTNFKKSLFYLQKYVSDIKGYDDFHIGWIYHTGDKTVAQDIKKAEEYYLKASKVGYKAAYRNLIFLYYGEDALNINNKKAVDYARIGSEHGVRYSTYMLAQFYDEGLGVQQDKKKALAYYLTLLRSKTFTDDFEDLPEKIGNIYMALKDYSNAKKYLQNKE